MDISLSFEIIFIIYRHLKLLLNMKHLFLFFSFILIASFSANAQSCSGAAATSGQKACCAAKSSASINTDKTSTELVSNVSEADEAMMASEGKIVKITNEETGEAGYYEKYNCPMSGEEKFSEVKYDSDSKKFTEVASATMSKDNPDAKAKSCCASKAGAAGKSCAKSANVEAGDKKGSCCSAKKS